MDERGALAELDWAGADSGPRSPVIVTWLVAAGLLWGAVTDGTLTHRGQVELTRGVIGETVPDARRSVVWLGPENAGLICFDRGVFGVVGGGL